MPINVKMTSSRKAGSSIIYSPQYRDCFTQSTTIEEPARTSRRHLKEQSASMSETRRLPYLRNSASACFAKRKDTTAWLSHNSFTHIQANADVESCEANAMAQTILDTENGFVKELDNYLKYKEMRERWKKELLCKKWTECVSGPVQHTIEKHIKNHCYEKAKEGRRMFLQYLDCCNKKGYVFLEDYDPREYNPFLLHLSKPHYFKFLTPTLNDPLLKQSYERMQEERLILLCQTGKVYSDKEMEALHTPNLPLIPKGRHGVDSIKWLLMPLGDIESDVRRKIRKKSARKVNSKEE
ncbi:protein FAM228A [Acipenser oxyrinchus oxyrinchus]|uniref:Protein FAM228A n=1 Tax=Acipenser oxyrinchus oxyrinchus TaxID=40147 RepID=A0AAD8G9L0_ACIOX|nr:protein FAM228A [Acipenser oxyrinchus oxyrinchus]